MRALSILTLVLCGASADANPVVHNGRIVDLQSSDCKIVQPFDREGFSRVTWTGECVNGMAHGSGRAEFTFRDGWFSTSRAIFHGEMVDGQRHGFGETEAKGIVLGENLTHYKGQYRNGLRHGIGRLFVEDSSGRTLEYEGSFQYSQITGYGELVLHAQDYVVRIAGEFNDAKPHGYAEFQVDLDNGRRISYHGNFERGRMHGYGIYSTGGRVYEGEFINGCLPRESLTDLEIVLSDIPRFLGLGRC